MDSNIIITDWILAVATLVMAGGTLLLGFVAIFQDWIRDKIKHPTLNVHIDVSPPDCHKTRLVRRDAEGKPLATADAYYFRLRVTNSGNHKAEMVEVFAAGLSKRQADGMFTSVESFLPMNLVWSHYQDIFFPAILPETYKHCDLAHVIDPNMRGQFEGEDNHWPAVPQENTILSFNTAVKPHTLSHLTPFGTYHLDVVVSAANAQPVKKTLEIHLTGNWYDDEREMFREGVRIRSL